MKHTNKKGFTLVELAIVLVIIGLIIGGVLAGQDLIKAATIKSQLTQIEQIDQAATTFQTKYSGLPGDLLSTKASQYSLSTGDGTAGKSDGNGVVEGCSSNATTLGCETGIFFNQLSSAKLIAGNYTVASGGGAAATAVFATALGATNFSTYLPKLKVRDSGALYLYSAVGKNQLALATVTTDTSGVVTTAAALSPAEAKAIDEKKDDGAPWTGSVIETKAASSTVAMGTVQDSTTGGCSTSSTAYKLAPGSADVVACILQLKPQF